MRVRVEVGDEARQSRDDHATDSELIADASLLALEASLGGRWLAALTHASAALSDATEGHAVRISPETRALLQDARVDAHLRAGPIRRSEWPVRRGTDGAVAEGLPLTAQGEVRVRMQGTLASLASRVELVATTPSLALAGLDEPARVRTELTLAPAQGETIFGPLRLTAVGSAALSPEASAEVRREARWNAAFTATGDGLLSRGMQAMDVQRLDVDTDAFPPERLEVVRNHEVTGTAALQLRASGDRSRPVRLSLDLEGLRAETRQDGREHARTAPMRVELNTVVLRNGDHWDLRTCASANPMAEPAIECEPEREMVDVPSSATSSMRAQALVPLVGGFGRWRVEPERGRARLSARGLRLEPLASVLPAETVSYLGGVVSTNAHWNGGGVETVGGTFSLAEGRVEIPALGEPVRNMAMEASMENRRVTIASAGLDLGRGHMSATGNVVLGDDGVQTTLALDATQLPAVQEGNTYGWLDGHADVNVAMRPQGLRGDVTLDRAQVLLHEQNVRTLQSPQPPSVFFVLGRTRDARVVALAEDAPMDFTVSFASPMWVRRDDFQVAVRGSLGAHIDRAGTSLSGSIDEASGHSWISQQGKRFDITHVNVQFGGGPRFDPILDIDAHHTGAGISRIDAHIGGRLSQIELTLSSVNYPDASMAEIASMLIFGRRDATTTSSGASEIADRGIQMLAGQFVSFLSNAIGRQMAFRLRPILESGDTQRGGTGVSVSPRLYVEASVASSSSALGQSTTGTSALEFRSLGEYVLTSTMTLSSAFSTGGASQYRWSVDLFWTP